MSFEHYLGMGGAGRGGVIGADGGGLIELPGWRMRVKVSASDTGGHLTLTPSGYEFFFERLAALIRAHGSMPSKEELGRLMAEHGTYPATPLG